MKFEYTIGFIAGLLFFLIVQLIIIYLQIQISIWSLIFAFALCCFIGSILIVFALSNAKEDRVRSEEYERKSQETYHWLMNVKEIIVGTMQNYTAARDLSYNNLLTSLNKDIDIIVALHNYLMLREYESAIGKLRHKEKEKAFNQIKDAEEAIAAIKQNPAKQRSIFFSKYEEAKKTFESMSRSTSSDNHEEQKWQQRVVCLNCGEHLSCSNCGFPIIKGNFILKKQESSFM